MLFFHPFLSWLDTKFASWVLLLLLLFLCHSFPSQLDQMYSFLTVSLFATLTLTNHFFIQSLSALLTTTISIHNPMKNIQGDRGGALSQIFCSLYSDVLQKIFLSHGSFREAKWHNLPLQTKNQDYKRRESRIVEKIHCAKQCTTVPPCCWGAGTFIHTHMRSVVFVVVGWKYFSTPLVSFIYLCMKRQSQILVTEVTSELRDVTER